MADHSKAAHHHAKAGKAFERGDVKGAAHHMGHALAALRKAKAAAQDPQSPAPAVEASAPTAPGMAGLRGRLKGFPK